MKTATDPAERFQSLDANSSGGLDSVELSDETRTLAAMTGTEIDVEEMMTTYDADGDKELSEDEMKTMIGEVLGSPPEMQSSGAMASVLH